MNLDLAPKRSIERNFSKNSGFHDERSFWPIIPCIIECAKPQGSICKGPQAVLTITLELNGAFF